MFLQKCQRLTQTTLILLVSIGVLLGTNFLLRQRLLHWLIEQIPSVLAAPERAPSLQGSVIAVPQLFNYQGNLRDPQGNPLSGSYNMTFRIYESVSAANALWTEQINGVTVRNGAFNALLGATVPLPATLFSAPDRFIGVTVAPYAEMAPRQRFASVPYAMRANEAISATSAVTATRAGAADIANRANIATTATNLQPGGSILNVITFGANGRKELAFAPNAGDPPASGTLLYDTNGLTITGGGPAQRGYLNGRWETLAIKRVGNSPAGTVVDTLYGMSLHHYVVEAKDSGSALNSIPIDDAILRDLCADPEGCWLSLSMRNGDDYGVNFTNGPNAFSLSGNNWIIFTPGNTTITNRDADNNGVDSTVLSTYDCYMQDSKHNQADREQGFWLLNGNSDYKSPNMSCILVIED